MEQKSDSIQISVTFSGPIETTTPCFINKLKFLNEPNRLANTFAPLYPGICQDNPSPSPIVVANMDPRDYANALGAGIFTAVNTTYLAIAEGMEVGFLPSVNLSPMSADQPMRVQTFTAHVDSPAFTGFDVDLENDFILLHFTDLMDITHFDATQLTLRNQANSSYSLSPRSRPRRVESNFVKTVCVDLADNDKLVLTDRSICTRKFGGSCFSSFSSSLARNYRGNLVDSISPTMSRPVKMHEYVYEERVK